MCPMFGGATLQPLRRQSFIGVKLQVRFEESECIIKFSREGASWGVGTGEP